MPNLLKVFLLACVGLSADSEITLHDQKFNYYRASLPPELVHGLGRSSQVHMRHVTSPTDCCTLTGVIGMPTIAPKLQCRVGLVVDLLTALVVTNGLTLRATLVQIPTGVCPAYQPDVVRLSI